MTAVAMFTRTPPRIGDLVLDCIVNETHQFTAQVSKLPVESGTSISDNRRLELPGPLTIDGIVGGAPLSSELRIDERGRTIVEDTSLEVTPRDAFDKLVRLYETETPIEVVTGVRLYRSMVIESLTVSRNHDSGSAIHFTAELVHVRVVHLSGVVLDPPPADADKIAEPVDQGKKDPVPVTNVSHKTALLELVDALFNFSRILPLAPFPVPGP